MPRWGIHLIIANRILNKKQKIDKNQFLFGNILPDLQDGYLVKDISNIINHDKNHYNFFNGKEVYQNFYDTYSGKLENSVMLGYFTHLITDYYFNKTFEEKYVLDNKGRLIGYKNKENKIIQKSKEEILSDKHLEFKIHEDYIYNTYNINIPFFTESLVVKSNKLKNINIRDEDIKKAISFIEENKKNSVMHNIEFFIFQKGELENEINTVVNISCELLDKINIGYK